jgi:hypothetical protein
LKESLKALERGGIHVQEQKSGKELGYTLKNDRPISLTCRAPVAPVIMIMCTSSSIKVSILPK